MTSHEISGQLNRQHISTSWGNGTRARHGTGRACQQDTFILGATTSDVRCSVLARVLPTLSQLHHGRHILRYSRCCNALPLNLEHLTDYPHRLLDMPLRTPDVEECHLHSVSVKQLVVRGRTAEVSAQPPGLPTHLLTLKWFFHQQKRSSARGKCRYPTTSNQEQRKQVL